MADTVTVTPTEPASPTSVEIAAEIIKKFEGRKLKAYICPAGKWTIGYGHTGDDVCKGLEITQEQADKLLIKDLSESVLAVCNSLEHPVGKNQMAALFSFTFNVGVNAFKRSTLLKLINQGKMVEAVAEFKKWVKVGGVPNKGLIKRREEEAKLFATT